MLSKKYYTTVQLTPINAIKRQAIKTIQCRSIFFVLTSIDHSKNLKIVDCWFFIFTVMSQSRL